MKIRKTVVPVAAMASIGATADGAIAAELDARQVDHGGCAG